MIIAAGGIEHYNRLQMHSIKLRVGIHANYAALFALFPKHDKYQTARESSHRRTIVRKLRNVKCS